MKTAPEPLSKPPPSTHELLSKPIQQDGSSSPLEIIPADSQVFGEASTPPSESHDWPQDYIRSAFPGVFAEINPAVKSVNEMKKCMKNHHQLDRNPDASEKVFAILKIVMPHLSGVIQAFTPFGNNLVNKFAWLASLVLLIFYAPDSPGLRLFFECARIWKAFF